MDRFIDLMLTAVLATIVYAFYYHVLGWPQDVSAIVAAGWANLSLLLDIKYGGW